MKTFGINRHSHSPYCNPQAPFSKGEKKFRFESAASDPNKDLPICRVLGVGEVRFKIMQYLSYHDIGALQGTCTMVANQVMGTPVCPPFRATRRCTDMT